MKTNNTLLESFLISSNIEINEEFIKATEKIIRNSLEYKKYLFEKREVNNENSDLFLSDLDFTDKKIQLELHHIITLYDICNIVLIDLLNKNYKNISTFEVANEVMKLHWNDIIPYVFLCKTLHQAQHTEENKNKYKINKEDIKGNYKEFLIKYNDITPNEIKLKYPDLFGGDNNVSET